MNRTIEALLACLCFATAAWGAAALAVVPSPGPRRAISLDGLWEIGQGSLDQMPAVFARRVPVPGLADMARPRRA